MTTSASTALTPRAWWHRPPGLPLALASLIACGTWMVEASTPQDGSPTLGVAILAGLSLIAFTWIGRTMISLAHRPRWSVRYAAVPLIGLITLGLVYLDVPFAARWIQAKPAFEHAAHAALADAQPTPTQLRLGTFSVTRSTVEGTVRFRLGTGAIGDTHYIVFSPAGRPHTYGPPSEHDRVAHFDGPWWRVIDMY
ncbi:hypothetical protein TPAU25S_03478 [Tsukamurella paurometabola]|uniref:DUF1109 domain-containing protein n=1 Tax=Tsukamurella paurometabola (strain ATCC 8368 / DSM 20162 / CCUG 35730 / CIP 100753 / JCM 10117 / KCTC 9821 / NBRC 16120 / NCIMB 702349 / NCTC 13040) TaxID=521096 RepID=D5UQ40_TSUPD|nr:hypothetical protein [Tsukamurella paurometabola]ADG76808.1 hypothetical protein Tpau_0154 [Tsukamurella paurometabola DSM 20162]SUP41723.1 Uncharacterised protein [Tsukamurella paurometabola]